MKFWIRYWVEEVATMIGCLPTQVLAFLAVFVYATQAIAFEWKPGFKQPATRRNISSDSRCFPKVS